MCSVSFRCSSFFCSGNGLPQAVQAAQDLLRIHLLHPSSYIFGKRSSERLIIPKSAERYGGVDRMLALAPLPAPTWFTPRLMHSVTDRATPVGEDRSVENAARAPFDTALPIDDARRVSIDSIYQRHSPASPLETQPPLLPLPHAEPMAPRHSGAFRSACIGKLSSSAFCHLRW